MAVATVAEKAVRVETINAKAFASERSRNAIDNRIGQGWIRTSEGVKPADLQSAPFGHFGTYPLPPARCSPQRAHVCEG
jgi:hypothetical protein